MSSILNIFITTKDEIPVSGCGLPKRTQELLCAYLCVTELPSVDYAREISNFEAASNPTAGAKLDFNVRVPCGITTDNFRAERQLDVACIHAFGVSATNLNYNESVIFSHSRIRCLRWQRSGWACSHRATRGEGHCDNGEECRT
jgi:hypothetical protein